ncbi:hypothetical protein TNCT_621181, partial [Trichonephila clavata]
FTYSGDIRKCLLREREEEEEGLRDKIRVSNNLNNKDNPREEEDLQDKIRVFSNLCNKDNNPQGLVR